MQFAEGDLIVIRTLADLLRELIERELPILDANKVTHAPTIGDMYEGLAGNLLEKTIPRGLRLRVVTGFVTDGVRMSGQMDRMLVQGQGECIPFTDSFVWHVEDVIAVVESKKTLRGRELGEAVKQLQTVKSLERDWDGKHRKTAYMPRLANLAFSQMTGIVAPSPNYQIDMSLHDRKIFNCLLEDNNSIIRIAMGLHGYNTEMGLRKGFANFLQTKIGAPGYGPVGLPHLIISGSHTLVKSNGQPYVAPLIGGLWPVMLSTSANPMLILLELIWTRLQRVYSLEDPWGTDLAVESMAPLILGRPIVIGEKSGWELTLRTATAGSLREGSKPVEWYPAFVSEAQYLVLNMLIADFEVSAEEPWVVELASEHLVSVDELWSALIQTRLVAANGPVLELIAISCHCAILTDGRYVAAENNTGRLSRWIMRHEGKS